MEKARLEILEKGGIALGLAQTILTEGVLILAAGLTFLGGVRGVVVSAVLLSLLNAGQSGSGFWLREGILALAACCGMLMLVLVNRKSGANGVVNGVVGSFLSLIIFAVFVTPILALVVWMVIVGAGMVPRMHRGQVLGSFAPTLIRVVLAIGWILVGNLVVVGK